jgi:hypothetical protein
MVVHTEPQFGDSSRRFFGLRWCAASDYAEAYTNAPEPLPEDVPSEEILATPLDELLRRALAAREADETALRSRLTEDLVEAEAAFGGRFWQTIKATADNGSTPVVTA